MSQDGYYLSQIVVSHGDTGYEEEAQHLTQMGNGVRMASLWCMGLDKFTLEHFYKLRGEPVR